MYNNNTVTNWIHCFIDIRISNLLNNRQKNYSRNFTLKQHLIEIINNFRKVYSPYLYIEQVNYAKKKNHRNLNEYTLYFVFLINFFVLFKKIIILLPYFKFYHRWCWKTNPDVVTLHLSDYLVVKQLTVNSFD